jgi:hypothetical protein
MNESFRDGVWSVSLGQRRAASFLPRGGPPRSEDDES